MSILARRLRTCFLPLSAVFPGLPASAQSVTAVTPTPEQLARWRLASSPGI